MTKTMRIITLLLLTMVGAGQMWAETDEPSNIKRGTITGGSIAFYADEACTSDFEGDVAANATVYVKATPEPGNTAIGVTFTAKKGISTDAMQAPRRSAEGPGIADDITVSAVTGKPGIYSFTMPNAENTNVTITASFAEPVQQQVSYVDENGESQTVNAYVLDETMRILPAGTYVVPDGLTLDHGIESNGSGSTVTIIIPDGKTLAVGSDDSSVSEYGFSMGRSLRFYGQTNATGKLAIYATSGGISIGGSVKVAHLDVDIVSRTYDGIRCSDGVTIIGCAKGSNMVKVHSASTCISGGQKSVTIKYCDVDVVCEGSMIAIDCLASVTIEGVSTGAQVNTVNVRSAGDCIGTSNNPVTISYCNVEMTGTTQTDNVYDACGSSGITTSGGVVITGRTDVTNTLKVRCGGNTTSSCYGISGGNNPVTISHYNVDIVNEKGYGIYTAYDVTITGGQVEITGGTNGKGIYSAIGNITYTWVSTTDYIKASSYYLNSSKAVVFADGQRFVAYDDATGTTATAIVSGSNKDTNATFTLDDIAGKTLKPLAGLLLNTSGTSINVDGKTEPDVTIGGTPYYIFNANDNVDLSYAGEGMVRATATGTGASIAKQVLTMGTSDVVMATEDITVEDIPLQTYTGSNITPLITVKIGDETLEQGTDYTCDFGNGCKNVGAYDVTVTGRGTCFGSVTKTLTIDKAPLTITAKDHNIYYGDEAANDGVEYEGFVLNQDASVLDGTLAYAYGTTNGENFTDYTKGDPVGDYEIILSGLTSDNYDITFAPGKLTVNPAPLTVTANNKSINYGENVANNGVAYSGFVNNEGENALSGTLEFDYTYNQYGPVGEYEIMPRGLMSDNYAITFAPGTLTVSPKSLTIDEWSVSIEDKVYDGTTSATISGSVSLVEGMIVRDDQVSVASSGVSAMFEDENVGSNKNVAVTGFALDGPDKNNYVLTSPGFTLKGNITKAPLTVTAKNKTINYGDEAANDGVTYSGFVNNEDASVLGGTLAYSYTNNNGAYGNGNNAVGTYQITPSGLTSDNYKITFNPGTLTVSPKPNTAYTVKHYQQNLADDGYPTVATATEDKTGAGGEQTAAEAKDYTGFTAQAFSQETIAADGTTVVKIYYTRNKYNVTLPAAVAEGSITTADGTSDLKYGASITLNITTNEGYTLKSICATGGATLAGSGHTRTLTMADQAVSVQADWEAVTPESKTTEVTENVTVVDANNAEVSSIEVGAETTTVTIPGTVNDGTNDVPVTSIADGTFTAENTANVQSIDLSETQVDLDMDRKADDSPVKDVPDNTLIYLPEGSTMTGDNVIVKGAGSSFTCNNFVMTDTKSYSVPHAFTASNATLNREFTAKQTCTVCLPYDVPAAGIHGKIYTFTSVANNQVTMTEDADGLNANVPYIFVPDGTNNISTTGSITVEIAGNNTSASDFTFKSIYEDHTFTAEEIAKGIYGFAGSNAVGATPGHFAKAATGAYIRGMRAYLEYTGSETNPDIEGPDVPSPRFGDFDTPLPNSMDVILVDADGTTTNIGKLELVDNDDSLRYNLGGQRVSKSHKGMVIKNGRKVVIK